MEIVSLRYHHLKENIKVDHLHIYLEIHEKILNLVGQVLELRKYMVLSMYSCDITVKACCCCLPENQRNTGSLRCHWDAKRGTPKPSVEEQTGVSVTGDYQWSPTRFGG